MEKIVYAFKFNTHMFQSKHLPLWNLEKLLIKLVWEFFNRCNLFAIVCHPLPTLLKQEEILNEYMPKQFKQLCQLLQQTLKLENMLAWIGYFDLKRICKQTEFFKKSKSCGCVFF